MAEIEPSPVIIYFYPPSFPPAKGDLFTNHCRKFRADAGVGEGRNVYGNLDLPETLGKPFQRMR